MIDWSLVLYGVYGMLVGVWMILTLRRLDRLEKRIDESQKRELDRNIAEAGRLMQSRTGGAKPR
jgi:hypothetical protein